MTALGTQERDMEMFRSQATTRGFQLIPLDGKRPLKGSSWQKDCQGGTDFDEAQFGNRNVGVCCGPSSGVIVLDVDDPDAFELLSEAHGWELPETYTVRTGGGGLHLYYMYPDDGNRYGCKSLKHPAWSGHTIFDVKGDGGYVVAAGSVHPESGRRYTVENHADLASAPEWLKRYVIGDELERGPLWDIPLPDSNARQYVESLRLNEITQNLILEGKPAGERSEAIWRVLLDLLRQDVDEKKIEFVFEQYPIGEKFREKGKARSRWLQGEIGRARQEIANGQQHPSSVSASATDEEPYPEIIEELNAEYAVVQLSGKTVIMKEITEPTFNRPDVHFLGVGDFNSWFANRLVPNPTSPGRQISIAKHWITSPRRRQYQGVVFNPERDTPGYYNLWRGFGVSPRQGDWSLMDRHIREVIAGGDLLIHQYIIHWMADLVQNPGGKRPGVSIVLRGEQGTGKGCFVTNLGQIVGNHFLHITNQRQLTGRFNQHLKDALLVFVDEGIWAGAKEPEGILKAMITEDVLMVEPKGKDIFTVKNHVRLIFASNNQWVVPAGMGDRRFMVLDVSNVHARDRSWFDPIWKQMGNGGKEAMLHDLLEVDLSEVDLRVFPRTEARLEQIESSMDSFEKFWFEKLQEGKIKGYVEFKSAVETQWFHSQYVDFAKTIGDRFTLSRAQFGKALHQLCPGMHKKRQSAAPRDWEYHFPPLEECRAAFEQKVGQPIKWD